MLTIYIVRHGQNEDNANGILNGHRDLSLTPLGIAQAKNLAIHLRNLGLTFDKVYTSPLSRAYVTAEIIADNLGLATPEKHPDLIERNFGVMTGEKIADIEKLCAPNILKTQVITYFITCPGAETFPELILRGKRLLADIRTKHANGNILFVCHGDIGKMIYAAFYGIEWLEALKNFHFGNSEVILLSEMCKPEDAHFYKQEQFNH